MTVFKKRVYLHLILAIVISASLSAFITFFVMNEKTKETFVRLRLNDLEEEIFLLKHLSDNYPSDELARRQTELLVLSQLLTLSVFKPDFTKIRLSQLEAIVKTIQYLKKYHFVGQENQKLYDIVVHPYLNEIDDDVFQRLSDINDIRRNPFKEWVPGARGGP